MTRIYLVRHAEAEGNLYRRIHGRYDALVTENGFRQIACLEERFRPIHIDAVYSSGLYRTEATARAIYRPKGLPLHTDPGLLEVNMGVWEDVPWGWARRFDREALEAFNTSDPSWQVEGGETLEQVGLRVHGAICRIAAAHPDQTIALVSHGSAIRQAMAVAAGIGPEGWRDLGHSDNTAVSLLEYQEGKLRIIFQNDASHLPTELSTLARQAWWRKDAGTTPADVNLWYRPLDWATEQDLYRQARQEAWVSTHGPHIPFQAEGFLEAARGDLAHSPWGVTAAMAGDELAGLIQLDTRRYAEEKAGYIPFCYIFPQRRFQHLGVQLIGQAVHFFRPLGRDRLRLRCAPCNQHAQKFYARYGFRKIGEEEGGRVPLDILEKYIGFDQ